ncbi:hypothetical protein [Methylococcus mesophilus]|uniref:hypothetical protein n=1 Tax=Methylococcus mesophilus TaxID=2993564 RepID=UPI00224A5CB8|nr:hypothetical protein [Methylococcus mesophilus]UZR29048.1 hypothetical protein OOT43_00040 [Methylococcus mesophilus]
MVDSGGVIVLDENFDLVIKCIGPIGPKLASDIECSSKLITNRFNIIERVPEFQSSAFMDVVVCYIVAYPIINGFLAELGALGARSLKSYLGGLITKIKRRNCRKINEQDLENEIKPGKVAKNLTKKELRRQCKDIGIPVPPLGITFRFSDVYCVDFVFPIEITPAKTERALSTIIDKIAFHMLFAKALPDLVSKYDNCEIFHILTMSELERTYVYENDEWVIKTPKQITESEHKLRNSRRK